MAVDLNPKLSFGETTTLIKSVADEVILTDPKATPLLKTLSPNLNNLSSPAISNPHYWVEDTLMPQVLSITAALTTGDVAMTVTANMGEYFRKGMVVKIDDELIVVDTTTDANKGSDTISILRGYGYTTAVPHVDSSDMYIVSHTGLEDEGTWDSFYIEPTMPYNNFQIFYAPVETTMIEQASSRYGQGDPQAYHRDKALVELMKLIDLNLFYGSRQALAASTPGGMAGFEDTTAAFIAATHRSAQGSVALAEGTIEGAMQTCFEDVGTEYMPTLLVCNMFQKRKISAMWESRVRIESGENQIGLVIERIMTDCGPLDVLVDYNCPKAKVYLLNPSMIGIGPLQGNGKNTSFGWYSPGYTKMGSQEVLWGAYTMEMKGPKTHYEISGLTTS